MSGHHVRMSAIPLEHPPHAEQVPEPPPFELTAREPRELLSVQADLLGRIALESGWDRDARAALLGQPLRMTAACLQELPARLLSPTGHEGSLLVRALERAARSLRLADNLPGLVPGLPRQRSRNRHAWRYAAFLCGLLEDVPAVQGGCDVVSRGFPARWPGGAVSLWDWASAGRHWQLQAAALRGAPRPDWHDELKNVLRQFVPDAGMSLLDAGLGAPRLALEAALLGSNGPPSPLDWLRSHWRSATDVPIRAEAQAAALQDAMAGLRRDGVWTVNQRKSRLWWGGDGLFLVWPTAAPEIAGRVRSQGRVCAEQAGELARTLALLQLADPPLAITTPLGARLQALPLRRPEEVLGAGGLALPDCAPPLRDPAPQDAEAAR